MTDTSKQDPQIIQVVEERAIVRKRTTLTEGARVRTVVHEAQEVIVVPDDFRLAVRQGEQGVEPRPIDDGAPRHGQIRPNWSNV